MRRRAFAFLAWATTLCVLGASSNACAGDEIWRNDWAFSAPPTLARAYIQDPYANIAFAANGDIVIAGLAYSRAEYQIVRLSADGSLRWSANIGYYTTVDWTAPSALIATADGGALVVYGDAAVGFTDYVARIDASGTVAWVRQIPSSEMLEYGSDRVLVSGCGDVMTMLDRASGDILWQRNSGDSCVQYQTLAVDEVSGNIYHLAFVDHQYRLMMIGAAGDVVWETPVDAAASLVTLTGIADGVIYLHVGSELRALHANDASPIWTADVQYFDVFLAGAPAEPIARGPDSVARLAAATGSARWTTPLANSGRVQAVGDALIAGTVSNGIARIDLSGGAVAWTQALPATDSYGNPLDYFRFGGLSSGEFFAVAQPDSTFAAVPPVIERVVYASGVSSAIDVPAVPQAAEGASIADGTDRVLGVQSAWTPEHPVVRVRSLDAASGTLRWQHDAALDVGDFAPAGPWTVTAAIGRSDSAAVALAALSTPGWQSDPGIGALWLGRYDIDSGDPLWQRTFRDADQGATRSSEPIADANGDVFAATGIAVPCAPGLEYCGRQTLMKFARNDGHELWRFTNSVQTGGSFVYPQEFVVAGNDALVTGPFDGALSPYSLVDLDGSDGSVRWTSDLYPPLSYLMVFPADDGIYVVGAGWAKLDRATGTPLWTGPVFVAPCTIACYANDWTLLGNGDIVIVGEGDRQARVTVLRGDGSGEFQNFSFGANRPKQSSYASSVHADSSGRVWIGLTRSNSGSRGIYVLAELDPANGALLRQQVLRDRPIDALERVTFAGMKEAPENNRLMLDARTIDAPAPTTLGTVALDTTVTAHGDLDLTLEAPAGAEVGQTIAFHARLTYTGDAPVSGVNLNVYLPWSSGARQVTCAASNAGPCATHLESGNVRATLDLAPGAVVDVRGQVLVLALPGHEEATSIGAVAFGPTGLDEADTVNNLARAGVSQGIFADGFDNR